MGPSQSYHLFDWHRLLVGQTPWVFLLEVVFRGVFTYAILWAAMRLMGKRVAAQMSALELSIVVTLGAAIGVPLQAPDRGMVPAAVILLIAIVYQRGLNFWAFKSRRAELALQGDVGVIVRDGRMDLEEMRKTVLSRERLFASLRGLVHLGQVRRAYMEAEGKFSLYEAGDDPPPGLCLLPDADVGAFEAQFKVDDRLACRTCGQTAPAPPPAPADHGPCPHCGHRQWSPAVRKADLHDLRAPDGG